MSNWKSLLLYLQPLGGSFFRIEHLQRKGLISPSLWFLFVIFDFVVSVQPHRPRAVDLHLPCLLKLEKISRWRSTCTQRQRNCRPQLDGMPARVGTQRLQVSRRTWQGIPKRKVAWATVQRQSQTTIERRRWATFKSRVQNQVWVSTHSLFAFEGENGAKFSWVEYLGSK